MEFYEVIRKRLSIRAYKPEPIPEDVLSRILEAGRLAPSAKNLQPRKFIVIKDASVRKLLVLACNGQEFIGQAPIVICACALEDKAWGTMGGYWKSDAVDVTIALEHMVLAAAAEGLGTCWIGSFTEAEVKKVLGIPGNVKPIALTPLGYPACESEPKPRKPISEIVCYDHFR
ncbi:nitroreductase [candidate division WOR-3 bacterium JGI_Cruoil_03_51_56]|uniref:Nitroreductase n=1 Tax=candidate division WOR-3 bacterium JGI_Cruoil_03_51_56 TaxID=1973747 RepID=A0A235BYF4_UNCW3|nr:MAG: nitroreductase [candidate division WOR-3 bacterium JGI_Cruoil_03_51_56]